MHFVHFANIFTHNLNLCSIYLLMDRGEYHMGVFVYLCKAFDSLDRENDCSSEPASLWTERYDSRVVSDICQW